MASADDAHAVRNVIARLAHLADEGDVEQYVELFTANASWEMPGAPRVGHAAIRAGAQERRAAGETGPGSGTRHVITTIVVHVDGDEAEADSYWLFYVNTAIAPELQRMGTYRDSFVRQSAQWRLARRQITFG